MGSDKGNIQFVIRTFAFQYTSWKNNHSGTGSGNGLNKNSPFHDSYLICLNIWQFL
jgi:hypothetical protein